MTRKEAIRQTDQENTLMALGFRRDEADQLRRISMTLHRWHELECGNDNGCIERDEETGRPFWHNSFTGRLYPLADREKGALKRLKSIIEERNIRASAEQIVCPNCGQWQLIDCLNECIKRRLAPCRKVFSYIQGDPRGGALYILRPGDVPEGADVQSYYNRGICVY
jgi:hypothetical protein